MFLTFLAVIALSTSGAALGATAHLQEVAFPEGRTTDVVLTPLPGAPAATLEARVSPRGGMTAIEVSQRDLKPALLFGGDVTCWVLWAASGDGTVENLGELRWGTKGKQAFTTPRLRFALLVTAESFALPRRPSALPAFANTAIDGDRAPSREIDLTLEEAPAHTRNEIRSIAWDPGAPASVFQARRLHELSGEVEADRHAGTLYEASGAALDTANELAERGGDRMEEAAARSAGLSHQAIRISRDAREAIRLREERETARRRQQETEERAERAEDRARELEAEVAQLSQQVAVLQVQRESLREEVAALQGSKSLLEDQSSELRGRLRGALDKVAMTRDSARGFVVSLPDILFGSNQATLRPGTEVVLAKLSGILLVMTDLVVRVEGHTDSTGTPSHNLELSQARADAVVRFLEEQGVPRERLEAVGLGQEHPIADNGTAEGRRKNRRVEIVLSGMDGGA